jgi:alkanesulfonate monooxygenase SsuD/methylene tetrahydromethanopterin reductase-like flavin-dependent oxidoreductase (luciferase family)
VNPTYAREMFYEAHDLIIQAWTQPGPTEFYGKFNKLRYVNIWPRPLQKPHPPIWIPGAGSLETMEYVARKRYAYMGIPYFHMDVFKRNFAFFRECCEKEGYTAKPSQMGFLAPIYISDTDAKAREEFEPHLWYFIKKLLPGLLMSPPGYTSPKSAMKIFDAIKKKQFMISCEKWEDIEEGDFAIVGPPRCATRSSTHEGSGRRERARAVPARHPSGAISREGHGLFARRSCPRPQGLPEPLTGGPPRSGADKI